MCVRFPPAVHKREKYFRMFFIISSVRSSSVYQGLIEIQILQILKCLDPTCAIFLKSWLFKDINYDHHINLTEQYFYNTFTIQLQY